MNPQLNENFFGREVLILNLNDPLENFAQVPQIECVVAFGWRWQQLLSDFKVHVNAALDDIGCKLVQSFILLR
jgi:hypothetical protein